MKKFLRRFLYGIFFVALLAVVSIVSIYIGRNFTGMGQVPARSAFSGRLPSTPDGDKRRFQFFYATDRSNDNDSFNGRGRQMGNELLFGTFAVRMSSDMPIKPFVWFNRKNIEWIDRQEFSRDKFLSQLREAVQASPQKSILIVVWGYRDWFQSAALKTAYTAYALDINTPVLLFDWPGNQGDGARGYAAARRQAELSAPNLGKVLAAIIHNTGAKHIWIMGSSLGSQTISSGLTWLAKQPDMVQGQQKIDHVVLSAPDVSAQAFDEKFADIIQKLSRHLTVFVSSNDRALLMSQWLNRGRRLGRIAEVMVPPEDRTSQYEFEEASELLELQAKGMKNSSIVDATPINLTRNLHHFFTDSPEFFDDLYVRLLQPDNNISRRLFPVRMRQGMRYWILWNY